jgi:hypothetical protein
LRLSLLAAALPMLDQAPRAHAQAPAMIATDLEVVTVTDTSVIVTWSTVSPTLCDPAGRPLGIPADTELRIAPADTSGSARTVAHDDTPTPYHYAEYHGLEPGRPYRFEAYSGGVRAMPAVNIVTSVPGAPETTGGFTTLVPPSGRYLRTIALASDLHQGETVSGLIADELPPGFRQDPGLPPYPTVMLDAMLSDLREPDRRADHLLVTGDMTAEAAPADVAAVRKALDSWGVMGADYFVVRGNHDRPHVGLEYHSGPAVASAPDHHDCWGEVFLPLQQLHTYQVGGLRLIGLDTTTLDGSGGTLSPAQLAQLTEQLRAEPDRPTVAFGHHPVTREAAYTHLAGPGFMLDRPSADALQRAYADAPGVFFHHSGHTHRNRLTHPDIDVPVEFLENASVKEYPGGYSLLRLYEGGYMVNFYKVRSEWARRWTHRSRGQYFGLYPNYVLGSLEERNHVVRRDLSGLQSA